MRLRNAVLTLAAAALVPTSALAEGIEGRWSLSIQGGTDVEISGDVHDAGSGTVLALPTRVEARSFSDVYDPGFRGQLAIGYGIGPRSEVFLRGSYYKMGSETLQVGTVAGLALNADFADYKEWGAELGYRYYFKADQPFKPYLGIAAGLRFVSELPSTFSVPAANVVLSDVPFYDSSTVGVFGGDLGFS
jgi:outer membrane protein W